MQFNKEAVAIISTIILVIAMGAGGFFIGKSFLEGKTVFNQPSESSRAQLSAGIHQPKQLYSAVLRNSSEIPHYMLTSGSDSDEQELGDSLEIEGTSKEEESWTTEASAEQEGDQSGQGESPISRFSSKQEPVSSASSGKTTSNSPSSEDSSSGSVQGNESTSTTDGKNGGKSSKNKTPEPTDTDSKKESASPDIEESTAEKDGQKEEEEVSDEDQAESIEDSNQADKDEKKEADQEVSPALPHNNEE
ncbi:hypothetical protein [Virgibacillus senegalensis]|uniref:hypothetical protein n=1 Tax=Virgibacillus senegalensis TaxID=1499679 RepID=UPI00069D7C60|nr:hypothetical protein [Virgibacillus senegalensis]